MIKILSVDDELDLELLLTQYFRRKIRKGEYEFYFAHNGVEAMQMLLQHPDIDIVLSDINMPEMDGLTLLKKIKDRNNPALKVVMVSAYGEMSNIRQAMNNGAFDFATKPIDLEDLERTIEKAREEIEFVKQSQKEHGQLVDLKADLSLAAEVQSAILPNKFPPFPDVASEVDIHATIKPAKDVGGDFYDFFRIDDDHLGFVIADVSGKGVPAALFMTMSYTLLRFTGTRSLTPVTTVSQSNDMLSKESFDSMFVTVFYGVYCISTGEMRYVNAGHNPPYIIKANGNVDVLPNSNNICMGVTEGFPYQESILKLEKGDMLVAFTDGVTEACDPSNNLYGEGRLESLLATLRDNTTQEVTSAIDNAVNAHANGAEQSDDITIMAIKRK
ncbi:MAG: SpoIIE family protein phosphatase [Prevotella sp.]|nr:SpoIIE family protein phosphatase [Prevotella sp.]